MYFPLQNTCMMLDGYRAARATTHYTALKNAEQIAPHHTNVGTIYAIRSRRGKTLWKYEQRAAHASLSSTAGGLMFGGDANGRFRAFDQQTGKVLWEVNLGSPISGIP